MRRFILMPVLLLAVVLAWRPAHACSVTEDFVRASSFELVEQADAVVVARAVSQTGSWQDGGASVVFEIEQALKGSPPTTVGMMETQLGRTQPSDPDTLIQAHPESFMGPCTRRTFQRGGRYVLFLSRADEPGQPGWHAIHSVFARSAEDYAGPDSLWVRALRGHIEVQANPDRMAQLGMLAARLPALEGPSASAADRQIAADIRDHLSSLSPAKPTPYLVAAYEALERGESPRFSIRGPEADREGGAADALTDMIFDVRRPDFDLERQKLVVLRSLANGEHPDAQPLFERILANRPSSSQLGLAMRYFSQNRQFRRAYDLVEREALPRLGGLPNDEASALLSDINEALRGPDYSYGLENEAWKDDAYARERWPELALSLFWDFHRRGSEARFDAIRSLRPTDFRARPEVTLALSTMFDDAVETWAIAEVDRLLPTADWLDDEDPLWLPLRVLAIGFGDEKDAALERAFCAGESGRIMVIQTLGLWGGSLDGELLIRMLAFPGADTETREQVLRALMHLDGRHASGNVGLFRNDSAREAIEASVAGRPILYIGAPAEPTFAFRA